MADLFAFAAEAPVGRLEIEISLPPVGCAQNTRKHWRVRATAEKRHRSETALIAKSARIAANATLPAYRSIVVTATWYCAPIKGDKRYRPLDGTNAQGALKAALDGLVDAGIVAADDHRSLKQMPPVLLRTKPEHGGRTCVVLAVEGFGIVTPEMEAAYRVAMAEKDRKAQAKMIEKACSRPIPETKSKTRRGKS